MKKFFWSALSSYAGCTIPHFYTIVDSITKTNEYVRCNSIDESDFIILTRMHNLGESGRNLNIQLLDDVIKSDKKIIMFSHGDGPQIDFNTNDWNIVDGKYKNLVCIFKDNLYSSPESLNKYSQLKIPIYPFDLLYEANNFLYDWTNILIDSEEQFRNRPISLFMCCNFETSDNRKLLGNVLVSYFSKLKDYHIITSANELNNLHKFNNIVILNSLHGSKNRISFDQFMRLNKLSKYVISIDGCGTKCWRHLEAGLCSILIKDGINANWSFPWKNNCIELIYDESISTSYNLPRINIEESLNIIINSIKNDNYDLYIKCVETCKKYSIINYGQNYLIPIIRNYI